MRLAEVHGSSEVWKKGMEKEKSDKWEDTVVCSQWSTNKL